MTYSNLKTQKKSRALSVTWCLSLSRVLVSWSTWASAIQKLLLTVDLDGSVGANVDSGHKSASTSLVQEWQVLLGVFLESPENMILFLEYT